MSGRVPFLDLGRLHASIRPELDAAFDAVLGESSFIGGGRVDAFERDFAAAHDRRHGVGCGSGTDALALALRALGVGPGDEVIVPAMTFVATAEAVVHVGATPVIADVDPETLLLTTDTADAVRSDRTRAVIPVHLYGHVVPFPTLEALRASGLLVVEDAAQAHLATWDDRFVGTHGHAACFSFYPGKNLGALGDAGLICTDDDDVAERLRSLRDHGRRTKYEHDEIGWCSRLDGLQAALLHVKLAHLPAWTEARRARADEYRAALAGPSSASLVPWTDGAVHHLLVSRVDPGARGRIRKELGALGIGSGLHYPVALSDQASLRAYARPCPYAEEAARSVLSLPMDPLMTTDEVGRIAAALGDLT